MPLLFDRLASAIAARAPAPIHDLPGLRMAAVALVLLPRDPPALLMIRRSEQAGDPWSGHMGFPGGRMDPADADPRATAIRETREELGLELSEADWLGELDPVLAPPRVLRPPLAVSVHAFGLRGEPALRPNGEVAAIHCFALPRLLSGDGRGSFDYEWQGQLVTLPDIELDGCRIWGMSLRMIDDLASRFEAIQDLNW